MLCVCVPPAQSGPSWRALTKSNDGASAANRRYDQPGKTGEIEGRRSCALIIDVVVEGGLAHSPARTVRDERGTQATQACALPPSISCPYVHACCELARLALLMGQMGHSRQQLGEGGKVPYRRAFHTIRPTTVLLTAGVLKAGAAKGNWVI